MLNVVFWEFEVLMAFFFVVSVSTIGMVVCSLYTVQQKEANQSINSLVPFDRSWVR
jgi:hypothetical protein